MAQKTLTTHECAEVERICPAFMNEAAVADMVDEWPSRYFDHAAQYVMSRSDVAERPTMLRNIRHFRSEAIDREARLRQEERAESRHIEQIAISEKGLRLQKWSIALAAIAAVAAILSIFF